MKLTDKMFDFLKKYYATFSHVIKLFTPKHEPKQQSKQSLNTTYDIFNVCAYIIYYCSEHNYIISNLKLQKVLYFLQVYFLLNKHRPLFSNHLYYGSWGVYVKEAHEYYSGYAGLSIPEREIYERYDFWNVYLNDISTISEEDKLSINTALATTMPFSSPTLLRLSSEQIDTMNLVTEVDKDKNGYYRYYKCVPLSEIEKFFRKD